MADQTYLLDMLNAARKVLHFVEELDPTAFSRSELHQSAVVKQLEIIGEAASRVSNNNSMNPNDEETSELYEYPC